MFRKWLYKCKVGLGVSRCGLIKNITCISIFVHVFVFLHLYTWICVLVFVYLYICICVFVFVSGSCRANAKLGRVSRDAGWFRNITHRQLAKEEPTRLAIKYPNGKGWNYKFKKDEEIQQSGALLVMQYFSNMANCISECISDILPTEKGEIINSRSSGKSNIRHSQEPPALQAFSSTNWIKDTSWAPSWGLEEYWRLTFHQFLLCIQLKTMKAWEGGKADIWIQLRWYLESPLSPYPCSLTLFSPV